MRSGLFALAVAASLAQSETIPLWTAGGPPPELAANEFAYFDATAREYVISYPKSIQPGTRTIAAGSSSAWSFTVKLGYIYLAK
jgi:hypothetical protein